MKYVLSVAAVLIMSLGLTACFSLDSENGTEVLLKNDTDSAITFTHFSERINRILPLTLEAGASESISYDSGAEDVTFRLSYKGGSYSGSTNYVQDYSRYTLSIYLDGESLKSQVNSHTAYTLKSLE